VFNTKGDKVIVFKKKRRKGVQRETVIDNLTQIVIEVYFTAATPKKAARRKQQLKQVQKKQWLLK
jgi:hypothetical protein